MSKSAGSFTLKVPLGFLLLAGTICTAFFVQAPSLFAQTTNATLSGTVMDPTGRVVPDVDVNVTNVDTNVSFDRKTNGSGIYVLPALPPGRYRVFVTKAGFKQIALTDVILNVQDSVSRNFNLQIGAMSETVTVSANTEHLATDNPAVGLLVNRTFVENTPLNGRSFQDLIALAPGAVSSSGDNGDEGLFSINGQRTNSNYFTVDGIAANLNPALPSGGLDFAHGLSGTLPAQTALGTTQALVSVDGLQEFKIQTSGYTAEYGRQPGGQVELTTRSGVNDPHGSVFDYFRNTVMDANDWFNKQAGNPRQAEHQNDFGGTIGGPLKIPKLYNGRDRTFYFVSYEGLRLLQPASTGIVAVPTAAFRQFAAPGLQPFLNSVPLPNGSDNGDQCALSQGRTFSCTGRYSAGYSNPSSLDSFSFRMDEVISQELQLFFRYANVPSQQTSQFVSDLINNALNTRTLTVGSTAKLRSSMIDEFRFSYGRSNGRENVEPIAFDGATPYSRSLVIPPQYAPPTGPGAGLVVILVPLSQFYNIPQYFGTLVEQHQYAFTDSLSWVRGSHSLKFGGDYRRLSPLFNFPQYTADFLLFSLASVQQGFTTSGLAAAQQAAHPVFQNLSLYAQDHWKPTPTLTLDYGVRWELNPTPGASDGNYPLALTTDNLATARLAPKGTPQYRTVYHDFAPRVGFAYNAIPSPNHPLVVRGGFGVFYDTGQAYGAAGYHAYPFFLERPLTQVPLPAPVGQVAPPPLNSPLVSPYGFLSGISDPNLKLPYTEQWNLSLDQALNPRNTLTLSYVGNLGRQLLFTQLFQSGSPSPINSNFTKLNLTSNAASSSYNALQVQDQGYITSGMQIIASFAWAHSIDNASSDNTGDAPQRGNSGYDVREVFNLALNYQLPQTHSNRILDALTHDWFLATRFSTQTGYPRDLEVGEFFLPDGSQVFERPDLIPGVPIYLHNVPGALGGWALNRAAFAGTVGDSRTPPGTIPVDANGKPLRQGTLPRNFVYGPGFWNLNTAIQRNFPVHERLRLIFRAEAFNLLNHPNAGDIDMQLYDSTFGQSIASTFGVPIMGVPNALYSSGAARSLQLALKLQF